MPERSRVNPIRYEKISLEGDPPDKTHHAIIFKATPIGTMQKEQLELKSTLPRLLTWTPTGHGWVSKWNIVLWQNEVALLVPRSLWIWYVPEFIRRFTPLRFILPKDPKDLFYLEIKQTFCV